MDLGRESCRLTVAGSLFGRRPGGMPQCEKRGDTLNGLTRAITPPMGGIRGNPQTWKAENSHFYREKLYKQVGLGSQWRRQSHRVV